jgi:hypothetical protein
MPAAQHAIESFYGPAARKTWALLDHNSTTSVHIDLVHNNYTMDIRLPGRGLRGESYIHLGGKR